jgi:hypothetical protein
VRAAALAALYCGVGLLASSEKTMEENTGKATAAVIAAAEHSQGKDHGTTPVGTARPPGSPAPDRAPSPAAAVDLADALDRAVHVAPGSARPDPLSRAQEKRRELSRRWIVPAAPRQTESSGRSNLGSRSLGT